MMLKLRPERLAALSVAGAVYLASLLAWARDDRRESSMMHNMSLPYSDSIIESVSSFYAGQPAQ